MEAVGSYSLKRERIETERQIAMIRLLLCITAALIVGKTYILLPWFAQADEAELRLRLQMLVVIPSMILYSLLVYLVVRWRPDRLKLVNAACSAADLIMITYLVNTLGGEIPFYLWYVFYVVSIAIRYGWYYSVLALSASVVSFTAVAFLNTPKGSVPNVQTVLGYSAFLMVVAFMFGRISDKQLTYQASMAVVNEFRWELSSLATSRQVIDHMLTRVKELLNVEEAFFLPARRGVDGSEAPGLRSAGADPVLMSAFREGGGIWNVEEMLTEQRPLVSNRMMKESSFSADMVSRLGLRNLAASPMMVRSTPVGVLYAANRKDKFLTAADLNLLELVATQTAPVVENALLWERLREAAASEERLRIARDLHDDFLQRLAAIKLHLERCKILVSKDPTRALEGIDKIHDVATRGLAEVRSYLSELRMTAPEPSRFRQAIDRCVSEAAARGGFETQVFFEIPDDPIPPNVAISAYYILRELLNNIASHACAKNVTVKVTSEDGKLNLQVDDDGTGFDAVRVRAEKASEGHLGLIGVEERARQSNGTFVLASEPGKGTKALATLGL